MAPAYLQPPPALCSTRSSHAQEVRPAAMAISPASSPLSHGWPSAPCTWRPCSRRAQLHLPALSSSPLPSALPPLCFSLSSRAGNDALSSPLCSAPLHCRPTPLLRPAVLASRSPASPSLVPAAPLHSSPCSYSLARQQLPWTPKFFPVPCSSSSQQQSLRSSISPWP
jgi:hypothetical protein